MSYQDFTNSLPNDFVDFVENKLGGVITRGGDGVIIGLGFTDVATLTKEETKTFMNSPNKELLKEEFMRRGARVR